MNVASVITPASKKTTLPPHLLCEYSLNNQTLKTQDLYIGRDEHYRHLRQMSGGPFSATVLPVHVQA